MMDVLATIILAAIVYMLVRPQSAGIDAINAMFSVVTNFVHSAISG